MTPTLAILAISGAIAVGAASPGPSFVMVMRTALARSRSDGVAAAFGMGIGGVIFCTLALLGMRAVFAQAPWLYLGFKIAGGAYLLYLAFRMWMGAKQPFIAEAGAASRPQVAEKLPARPRDPAQQSEDPGLLRQRLRLAAGASSGLELPGAAAGDHGDRDRLVHDRGPGLLPRPAARRLSALEDLGRTASPPASWRHWG